VTNPYGTDPGPQSQGLGTPGAQGPQFIAPGAPGQYGPPQYGPPQGPLAQPFGSQGQPPYGQQGQPPYGQQGPYGAPAGYPPSQPYGQGSQQPPSGSAYQPPYGQGYRTTPPQRPRAGSASTVVVILVLVALVIGIAYGAYQLYQGTTVKPVTQPTPTHAVRTTAAPSVTTRPTTSSKATAATADCVSGDKISTGDFVATVPANWSCDGEDGDISIVSARDDSIWVEHDPGTGDLASNCKSQIEDLGTVTALPPETWGGKTAVAYQAVDSGDIYGVRCAVVGGQTWYLLYFPFDPTDDASVRVDVTKVMTTWVWK